MIFIWKRQVNPFKSKQAITEVLWNYELKEKLILTSALPV